MEKFGFLTVLAILQFIELTVADNLVLPLQVDQQKKKNININLEVNLGIGGNCTAADILRGNCTNYPNGTTLTPMVLTPIKPKTTEKRKFEKIGEYIKMNLCSYEFDDGRSCRVLCTLLGYVRYACSDLTLCHCWNKPSQKPQGVEIPGQDPGATRTTRTPGTTQPPVPTQGILVWLHLCHEGNDCAGYCVFKNYTGHECADDETCHCFGPKTVNCTAIDDQDLQCVNYCHGRDFESSRCLKDGTCECYNERDGPPSESEDRVKYLGYNITVPDCADNIYQCDEICNLLKFNEFECSGKDQCHCSKKNNTARNLARSNSIKLASGELLTLDCSWKNNGVHCKKRCSEKDYEIFECVRENSCYCYDEPNDGNIDTGRMIMPGNRMLVANSSLGEKSLPDNSTTLAADENRKNFIQLPKRFIPSRKIEKRKSTRDSTAQSDNGETEKITNSI